MRTIQLAALLVAALACGTSAPSQNLKDVLARMDEASVGFEDMSARLKWITHTDVLNENTEESGNIWIKRSKRAGLRMRIDFSKPDPKAYAFSDRKFEIYLPNIQTVQEFDLGKYGRLVDQFLLLGFGTPSRELLKSYKMKLLGREMVNGLAATRLELIPKSDKAREHLTKAELWISDTTGQPVQQKFYCPGSYKLATYLDVKVPANLSEDAIRLKLPKGVRREYPQK